MEKNWERCIPFLKINKEVATLLFKNFSKEAEVEEIKEINEGCRNTNYSIRLKNSTSLFLLRIFNEKDESFNREEALLNLLKEEIPMQRIYYLGNSSEINGRNYGIYSFVEGISLREFVGNGNKITSEFMGDIAKNLAIVHNHSYDEIGFLDGDLRIKDKLPPLSQWYNMFLGKRARSRLGHNIINEIMKIIHKNKVLLNHLDNCPSLVHGDFQGANLLIYNGRLNCVLDWEFAMAGHRLGDIAQFFRYEEYFNEELVEKFEIVYNNYANKELCSNWYKISKLRDLATLIQMIDTEEELPEKYKDIKKLIISYLKILS